MKGDPHAQDVEDSLSRLYKAHTALAHIMTQVDRLVLKAHKMSAHRQIGGLDLCGFSQFLETTVSSLQEWIPQFEDVTRYMQGQRLEQVGDSTSLQAKQKGDDKEMAAGHDKSWSSMLSENLLDEPANVNDTIFMDKENMLSDSPLVPWLERVQVFILTPMAKRMKEFSPILMHRCSLEDQETVRFSSRLANSSSWKSCPHAQALETEPASPLLLCKQSSRKGRVADNLLDSESSMHSPLRQQSFESPDVLPDTLATPLPPQSLVKRYSNFFEAEEQFTDSLPTLSVTPMVEQNQASHHKSAEEDEVESSEITEYFTAFSPPRSIAPSLSTSGRNFYSLSSTPHGDQEGTAFSGEHSTPMPPQSLMKRYSQFLHAEESDEMTTDSMMLLTPLLPSSPPKTCILMRPHHKEDSMKPRQSLQTPLLLLKSPFRTPGLFLRKAHDRECDEDMDLTSLKRPGQPPRPPQSVRRTPSSDMQFATVRRAPASIRRSPIVDLQLSTVRKPGAPLPGEQTLKRELWCRMEAEFANMAHVCKSLFTDTQVDVSADARAEKSGIDNKENLFVPRGLQQRRLNLYM